MAEFFMLGNYSREALKGISKQRTQAAVQAVEKLGGKVLSIYALLGKYDLALILELPSLEAAFKVSIRLTQLTGIAFSTCPALPVAKFDTLME